MKHGLQSEQQHQENYTGNRCSLDFTRTQGFLANNDKTSNMPPQRTLYQLAPCCYTTWRRPKSRLWTGNLGYLLYVNGTSPCFSSKTQNKTNSNQLLRSKSWGRSCYVTANRLWKHVYLLWFVWHIKFYICHTCLNTHFLSFDTFYYISTVWVICTDSCIVQCLRTISTKIL